MPDRLPLVIPFLAFLIGCSHQDSLIVPRECGAAAVRGIAMAEAKHGRPDQAAAALETSIHLTEQELALDYRAMGDLLIAKGATQEAERYYERSAALMRWKASDAQIQMPLPADINRGKLP